MMIKLLRLLAICSLAVLFVSTAWAQTYTTVHDPNDNAGVTELIGGPNPQGTSVGTYLYYDELSGVLYWHGFALSSQGVFIPIDYPGALYTQPGFISSNGFVTGNYRSPYLPWHGFVLHGGQYTTVDSDYPGAVATILAGITPSGEIAGYSCLADIRCNVGPFKSFIISKKGVFTHFDPPGTDPNFGSTASVINASGAIVGAYTGTDGFQHGYLLKNGRYTTVDYPGAANTFCGGMNDQGDIVGAYWNEDQVVHSYLLSHGVFTSFDPPDSIGNYNSQATGINNAGIIIGLYQDAYYNVFGYIRTP